MTMNQHVFFSHYVFTQSFIHPLAKANRLFICEYTRPHLFYSTPASICEKRNLFPSEAKTAVCVFRCGKGAEREDGCRVCDPAGFVVEL